MELPLCDFKIWGQKCEGVPTLPNLMNPPMGVHRGHTHRGYPSLPYRGMVLQRREQGRHTLSETVGIEGMVCPLWSENYVVGTMGVSRF